MVNVGSFAGAGQWACPTATNVGFPDDRREQVEQWLRQANSWKYCEGSLMGVDRANVIQYSTRPIRLEELLYGIKGACEVTDDLLSKVTPRLRKRMNIDG